MSYREIKTDYRKFSSDCYFSCTFLTFGTNSNQETRRQDVLQRGGRAYILPPDPLIDLRCAFALFPAAALSLCAAMLFGNRSLFIR